MYKTLFFIQFVHKTNGSSEFYWWIARINMAK